MTVELQNGMSGKEFDWGSKQLTETEFRRLPIQLWLIDAVEKLVGFFNALLSSQSGE